MQYNIVIAEDEFLIRETIEEFIRAEMNEFRIAGSFFSGEEALEFILTYGADVIITDIRMARLSGLDLMHELRERNINTPFIVISGYPDFAYAQKAIQYGATGYLIKPIDFFELGTFLNKIRSQIEENRQLRRQNDELFSLFLTYVLTGIFSSAAEIRNLAKIVRFPYSTEVACYKMLSLTPEENSASEIDFESLFMTMDRVRSETEHHAHAYFIHETEGACYYLIACESEAAGVKFIPQLEKALNTRLSVQWSIKIEAEASGLPNITKALRDRSFIHTIRESISDTEIADKTASFQEILPPTIETAQEQLYSIAIQYIEAHFMEDISREDVAKAIFVSQTYLSHLFRDVGNTSFNAYLTELRMKKACELLRQDLHISDIIARTGYHSRQGFLTSFRTYTGMTPSEYRQNALNIAGGGQEYDA